MMILRKALDRGQSKMDWLNSYHSFSFADYYDEAWMGFGALRVMNEDYIQASGGFDRHPHRNMEIITYVVSGALQHEDSMGNGSLIVPGEIQRMSAGQGVWHSEFNHSNQEVLHLLQIWILPGTQNLKPSYEQKKIPKQLNQLILIGSEYPNDQAVTIHQQVQVFVGYFEKDKALHHDINHPKVWLQLIKGQIELNNQRLAAGDGIGLINETKFELHSWETSEFLLFKM